MNILLTNDDGYQSVGIKVLEAVLTSFGHEVWVIAPSSNCSAFSHKMTVTGTVKMVKYGENHYHCSGSPTDCILYGAKAKFLPSAPDLVVSGINQGGNMSTDILYSGTCGAASEAAIHGIKAIAISSEPNKSGEYNYEGVAKFLAENLEIIYPLLNNRRFLNINAPFAITQKAQVCKLGYLRYPDGIFKAGSAPEGEDHYNLVSGGENRYIVCDTEETDFEICSKGGVALTFLSVLPGIDGKGQEELRKLYE